ncbi:hypothetical protein, partial [Streptomyces sp. WM4235]|uniref:hypothetical protein n=1 Tax=Streptomyces sp. WM4235 TaxID=1415551 RepID=UPI000A68999D
ASYAAAKERVLDPLLGMAGMDRLGWAPRAPAPHARRPPGVWFVVTPARSRPSRARNTGFLR